MIRMTTRNLYRRPVRTALTVVGVAVGVVAVVALTTTTQGFWRSVEQWVHVSDADLTVFQANVAADIFSLLDEQTVGADLAAIPQVESVVGTVWHILTVKRQPVLAIGLRTEHLDRLPDAMVAGSHPTADNEIMLGTLARRVVDRDVGDDLVIQGDSYKVVGIFRSDIIFLNGAIAFSLPRLQQLAGKEGLVTAFQVRLHPGADTAAVSERIERDHPELVAIGGASEYSKVDQGLEIMDRSVWALGFIAVVVGSIIVANTMWMSVLERTREIGVLRAVGWARRRIVIMILLEALGVALIASIVGCVLGVALAQLATKMQVTEQFVEPVVDARPFLLALGIAVVLGLVGALLPAWRATRISPAEALRYE